MILDITGIYNTLRNKSFELTGILIQSAPVTKIYCDERIAFGAGSLTATKVSLPCDRELGDVDYTGCTLEADDDAGTAVNILLSFGKVTAKPLLRIEDNAGDIYFVYSNNYTEIYNEIP